MGRKDTIHDSEASGARQRVARNWFFALPPALVLLPGLVTLGFEFVYDDPRDVEGAAALARRDPLGLLLSFRRPLKTFSYALDEWLFGGAAWGYHLDSLLWASLNAFLVTLLAWVVTGNRRVSLAAGVIFAVHPVHIEAVANVANRKDLLAFAFGVGAVTLLCRPLLNARFPGFSRTAIAILLLLLCALSKEVVAVAVLGTLVLLPFLGHRIMQGKGFHPPLRASVLLWVGLGLLGTLLLASVYLSPPAELYAPERIASLSSRQVATAGDWLVRSLAGAGKSAGLLFLPVGLSADHPVPPGGAAAAVAGVVFLLGSFALGFLVAPRRRLAGLGLIWFLPTILPVMNLLPLSRFFVAERYLYLPSLGVALVLASVLERLTVERHPHATFAPAGWFVGLALLAALGGAYGTARSMVWRDSRSLWTATCRDSPGSYRAHLYLGQMLMDEDDYEEALPHFLEAERIVPGSMEIARSIRAAYNNVGTERFAKGDYVAAEQSFRMAARILPANPAILCNLGKTRILLYRFSAAVEALDRAVALTGDSRPCDELPVVRLSSAEAPEQALDDLRSAAKAAPHIPFFSECLVRAYRDLQLPCETVAACETFSTRFPEGPLPSACEEAMKKCRSTTAGAADP